MRSFFFENTLAISLLYGGFLGFAIYESFSWLKGYHFFDIRHISLELTAIAAGAFIGLISGIAFESRIEGRALFFSLWMFLFIGLVLFVMTRIAIQPAI